jgi:hypothetical protein
MESTWQAARIAHNRIVGNPEPALDGPLFRHRGGWPFRSSRSLLTASSLRSRSV